MINVYGHKTSGWPQLYENDPDLSLLYQSLFAGTPVVDFHLNKGFLCHLGHLCVPSSECVKMIWEAHYIWVVGHFSIEKIVVVLKKYF